MTRSEIVSALLALQGIGCLGAMGLAVDVGNWTEALTSLLSALAFGVAWAWWYERKGGTVS